MWMEPLTVRAVCHARDVAPGLGDVLKSARTKAGLSLRDVERRTGVRSGHLSQIETGTIAKPEMAILWELAATYGVDFGRLLALAGYGAREPESARQRQRMTVALRAMHELSAADQAEVLRYMAELKARRDA
jgi:HTH-type transcriptional regulator, competence development regulator